jgi:hypothetical protein
MTASSALGLGSLLLGVGLTAWITRERLISWHTRSHLAWDRWWTRLAHWPTLKEDALRRYYSAAVRGYALLIFVSGFILLIAGFTNL